MLSYYIHSYSFISRNEEDNLAIIDRDSKKNNAAIYRKKLLGLQFHPEKSQINGLLLIKDYFNYHI